MFKSWLRDQKFMGLLVSAAFIKAFSLNEYWVERYYTYGIYPFLSGGLRFVLGWVPCSFGDLLYVGAFIFFVLKAWKLIRLLAKRTVKEYLSWILFRKYLKLVLCIYIFFNLLWGINYNRQGIASQLALNVQPYSQHQLFAITLLLEQRLNDYASKVDTIKRTEFENMSQLVTQGIANYEKIKPFYPFLKYSHSSIKASLFSSIGHYFGFSGYFNPFTGEAQINVAEPVFVKPFVINHEMAHQLGYAKENEANFVSYLACKNSGNVNFRYSVYYELFKDALYECRETGDTAFLRQIRRSLHPRVQRDRWMELQYRLHKSNRMSPYVTDFYDQYLKLNNQPKGMATYNEVLAWLMAYIKKNGATAL